MSYHNKILEVLKQESESIDYLRKNLEVEMINKAIGLLLECKGNIVTLGVGKSGFIAEKFSATMRSIGIPSLYLHPSEAMHGDIGILKKEDIIIIISYGGESEEILKLLPYIRKRKIKIISLLGNLNSTLAKESDICINTYITKEADIYNIVPTSSTTSALALTDAIAITLMQEKNVKLEDFAFNHPSGIIGKKLSLTVEELMHTGNKNPTVNAMSSWETVLATMNEKKLGAVSVIDNEKKLIGIITDGDIRRLVEKGLYNKKSVVLAKDMMTKNPVSIHNKALAYTALRLMEDRASQISVLPVVLDDNICIGMIRIHDVIRGEMA